MLILAILTLWACIASGQLDIVQRRQFTCGAESLFCSLSGDISLCRPGSTPVIGYSCGGQGCSPCPVGICNKNGQSACGLVPPGAFFSSCSWNGLYCDGNSVRYCTSTGLGWMVDWCGSLGCNPFPPRCNSGSVPTPATSPTMPPTFFTAPPTMPPTVFTAPPSMPPTFFTAPPTMPPFVPTMPPSVSTLPPSMPPTRLPTRFPTMPPTSPPTVGGPTCGPRIRNEWGASPSERGRFVRAVLRLHDNGVMVRLAQQHWNYQQQIHGESATQWPQFLVWHRAFVFEFEEEVRALGGEFTCFTVPYWNYEYSDRFSRTDPRSVFGSDPSHLGVVDGPNGCIGGSFANIQITMPPPSQPHCIQRFPTFGLDTLRCRTFMDLTGFGERDYRSFGIQFQRAHGNPHVVTGGQPPRIGVFATHASPLDPLFMLHHSNVDRVWALWQACRGDYSFPGGQNAFLAYYGLPFSDFISTFAIRWRGSVYSVSYAPDQFGNRQLYSDNFAQLLAQCQSTTTASFLASPILGMDQWAAQPTPGLRPLAPMSVIYSTQTVTCVNATGTSQSARLAGAVATYDSLSFQDCANQCELFYFKQGGARNCVCASFMTANAADPFSFNRVATDFTPSCPGSFRGQYALYRSPVVPSSKTCFKRAAVRQPVTPLTCSTPESSLSPLSASWLQMNNLGDSGDLCASFTPANVSLSVQCVQ